MTSSNIKLFVDLKHSGTDLFSSTPIDDDTPWNIIYEGNPSDQKDSINALLKQSGQKWRLELSHSSSKSKQDIPTLEASLEDALGNAPLENRIADESISLLYLALRGLKAVVAAGKIPTLEEHPLPRVFLRLENTNIGKKLGPLEEARQSLSPTSLLVKSIFSLGGIPVAPQNDEAKDERSNEALFLISLTEVLNQFTFPNNNNSSLPKLPHFPRISTVSIPSVSNTKPGDVKPVQHLIRPPLWSYLKMPFLDEADNPQPFHEVPVNGIRRWPIVSPSTGNPSGVVDTSLQLYVFPPYSSSYDASGPPFVELLHKWMNNPRVDKFWQSKLPNLEERASMVKGEFLEAGGHQIEASDGLVEAKRTGRTIPVLGRWVDTDVGQRKARSSTVEELEERGWFAYFEIYHAIEDKIAHFLSLCPLSSPSQPSGPVAIGPNDVGIHFLVGTEIQRYRGPDRVKSWLKGLVDWVFENLSADKIFSDPDRRNAPMVEYLVEAGFSKLGDMPMVGEKVAMFVQITRKDWESKKSLT